MGGSEFFTGDMFLISIIGASCILLMLTFWLWMLIDCLAYNDTEHKTLWIAVLVIGFVTGAIIYFVFQSEYSKFSKRCKLRRISLFG
jgi:hypothetical protein